jgi:uncharacterized protein YndB with AHSA1/START domain
MEKTLLKINAQIVANVSEVWEYYTNPSHITKWNFASDDWHCPSAENNLRVGGTYRVRMEAKDGSFGFDLEATYLSIEPGVHMTYVMTDARAVFISMRDLGKETLVEIEFEAEQMNALELQKAGWQAILNNFKKYVEQV